jgi:RNA polymerase sigma factor (sigma-70 family)
VRDAAQVVSVHAVQVSGREHPRRLHLASDQLLVEQVRAGSEQAFEVLFERHQESILTFCTHMLGSREEAEDVVQQTFIAAYRDLKRSEAPRAFRPWLYGIARHRGLSALRRRRVRPVGEVPEPAPARNLAAEVDAREDLRELLVDIGRLPDDQRAALVLAELEDLTHGEIAEILGCPRAKVKALVFQARSSLAACRTARETPCAEIREQLATLRGTALRRATLRRHLDDCAGCRAFRDSVRAERRGLRAWLPLAPAYIFKRGALGGLFGSGGGAGGAALGGSVLGGNALVVAVAVAVAVPAGGVAVAATAAAVGGGADHRVGGGAAALTAAARDDATATAGPDLRRAARVGAGANDRTPEATTPGFRPTWPTTRGADGRHAKPVGPATGDGASSALESGRHEATDPLRSGKPSAPSGPKDGGAVNQGSPKAGPQGARDKPLQPDRRVAAGRPPQGDGRAAPRRPQRADGRATPSAPPQADSRVAPDTPEADRSTGPATPQPTPLPAEESRPETAPAAPPAPSSPPAPTGEKPAGDAAPHGGQPPAGAGGDGGKNPGD